MLHRIVSPLGIGSLLMDCHDVTLVKEVLHFMKNKQGK